MIEFFKPVLLCVIISIAFRGKGGGFATWGIIPPGIDLFAHLLGAFMIGVLLGVSTHNIFYIFVFICLWLFFTKPGMGWAEDVCDTPTLRNLIKASIRQSFILPCALFSFYVGKGNPWFLLGILPLGSLYWFGGILNRKFKIDPIESAEWATGLSGIVFYALGIFN